MADKDWEQQLDERIRWNSFLPLLGTKAFEKLIGKVGAPLGKPPWGKDGPEAGDGSETDKQQEKALGKGDL